MTLTCPFIEIRHQSSDEARVGATNIRMDTRLKNWVLRRGGTFQFPYCIMKWLLGWVVWIGIRCPKGSWKIGWLWEICYWLLGRNFWLAWNLVDYLCIACVGTPWVCVPCVGTTIMYWCCQWLCHVAYGGALLSLKRWKVTKLVVIVCIWIFKIL